MSDRVPLARMEVSAADDPQCGIGIALFVAGCPRRCVGCQNPDLQTAEGFERREVAEIIRELEVLLFGGASRLVDCVVFLGGDWMLYPTQYVELASWAQSRGLRTVLYTGEIYEVVPESVRNVSDWVIDGPWRRDMPGVFPPSTNQRVFYRGELVNPVELPLYRHLSAQVRK
jgi:anaerobic ribonucleoside-triphosphate reductase activating protein